MAERGFRVVGVGGVRGGRWCGNDVCRDSDWLISRKKGAGSLC